MGDATTDSLYVLDNTYFQDDHPDGSGADFINRILTSPIGYDDGKLITYDACQLNMQQGTALRNGQGSAPVAMMAYSDDSGFTFGLEQSRSMGLTGQYAYRTRWTRCRSSRNRVWRFRISCVISKPTLRDGRMSNSNNGRILDGKLDMAPSR